MMKLWKTIDIADNERALLFRRNRLEAVLGPGRHRVLNLGGGVRFATYDISAVNCEAPGIRYLLKARPELLAPHLDAYEMADHQVGVFYRNGRLADVVAPGGFLAVWKGVESLRLDVVDISEDYAVDAQLLRLLRGRVVRGVSYTEVPDEQVGMLLVDGKFERLLPTGNYGYWQYNRSIVVKLVDLRLQAIEVSGQEILTKDRVSLRINLSGSYRVTNAETVALKLNDYAGFVYRELQLRLREAVGTRALDELLADKDSLNAVLADSIRANLADYGIEVVSVGVKDIILPGDMKVILNQVVEAQKESEANLIKRREETQAMRSLHNTAKMMENNPTLLRLKELEALERVTGQIDRISVYGGLDGVLNDLVKLVPGDTSD